MKKIYSIVGIIALVVLFAGCASSGTDQMDVQAGARAKVNEFLTIMTSEERPATMIDFISPSYMKAAGLNPSEYSVNTYYPKTYVIEQVFPSPDLTNSVNVVATIYGENKAWAHRLTFVVLNEDDKLSFFPGKHATDTKYVDPWYKIDEYVK